MKEFLNLLIEEHLDFNATALISNEIGGSNSLEPLIPAAITGLPVVDADGMGRAFPEIQMKTFFEADKYKKV